jgi:hypothetical protein
MTTMREERAENHREAHPGQLSQQAGGVRPPIGNDARVRELKPPPAEREERYGRARAAAVQMHVQDRAGAEFDAALLTGY